jgi:hypothetical protein
MGGFKVTILIRLILYIIYISPLSLPLSPLPTPPKATARDFFGRKDTLVLSYSHTLAGFI